MKIKAKKLGRERAYQAEDRVVLESHSDMFSTKPVITTLTMYNLDTGSSQAMRHPLYKICHVYQCVENMSLTHDGKWYHLLCKRLEYTHSDGKDEDWFLCLLP